MSAPAQLPPADELAAVRDQIAALKLREDVLRALMLTDPSARTGNRFLAEVVTVTRPQTDLKEMRAMHPELVAEFTFERRLEQVQLREISEDGEILARQRKPRTHGDMQTRTHADMQTRTHGDMQT